MPLLFRVLNLWIIFSGLYTLVDVGMAAWPATPEGVILVYGLGLSWVGQMLRILVHGTNPMAMSSWGVKSWES